MTKSRKERRDWPEEEFRRRHEEKQAYRASIGFCSGKYPGDTPEGKRMEARRKKLSRLATEREFKKDEWK